MTTKKYFSEWVEQVYPWFLSHGLKIAVIAVVAYVLGRVTHRLIERGVRATMVSDNLLAPVAEKKREDTLIRIFTSVVKIGILIMAILMVLQEMGLMIAPILAGAGIAGLAVGFGGQYLIRDVISGMFIILENQYRIGDIVSFDGTGGLVEDISLRMTTIRDLDGTVHHIPHGEIKKVSNLTKYFSRVNMNIGVGYSTNLQQAINIINQVGNDMAAEERWKPHIIQAPQFLRVDDFGDSAIVLKILGETQPVRQWEVAGELRMRLKIAFDQAGIEIPFPQRVVYVQHNEAKTKG